VVILVPGASKLYTSSKTIIPVSVAAAALPVVSQ